MTQYDAYAQTFSNSRKNMHWPEIDAILSDLEIMHYKSVLDIGCGNGRFVTELRKKFQLMEYLGVDASP
jgi:tRNA G46 methylase TrmB